MATTTPSTPPIQTKPLEYWQQLSFQKCSTQLSDTHLALIIHYLSVILFRLIESYHTLINEGKWIWYTDKTIKQIIASHPQTSPPILPQRIQLKPTLPPTSPPPNQNNLTLLTLKGKQIPQQELSIEENNLLNQENYPSLKEYFTQGILKLEEGKISINLQQISSLPPQLQLILNNPIRAEDRGAVILEVTTNRHGFLLLLSEISAPDKYFNYSPTNLMALYLAAHTYQQYTIMRSCEQHFIDLFFSSKHPGFNPFDMDAAKSEVLQWIQLAYISSLRDGQSQLYRKIQQMLPIYEQFTTLSLKGDELKKLFPLLMQKVITNTTDKPNLPTITFKYQNTEITFPQEFIVKKINFFQIILENQMRAKETLRHRAKQLLLCRARNLPERKPLQEVIKEILADKDIEETIKDILKNEDIENILADTEDISVDEIDVECTEFPIGLFFLLENSLNPQFFQQILSNYPAYYIIHLYEQAIYYRITDTAFEYKCLEQILQWVVEQLNKIGWQKWQDEDITTIYNQVDDKNSIIYHPLMQQITSISTNPPPDKYIKLRDNYGIREVHVVTLSRRGIKYRYDDTTTVGDLQAYVLNILREDLDLYYGDLTQRSESQLRTLQTLEISDIRLIFSGYQLPLDEHLINLRENTMHCVVRAPKNTLLNLWIHKTWNTKTQKEQEDILSFLHAQIKRREADPSFFCAKKKTENNSEDPLALIFQYIGSDLIEGLTQAASYTSRILRNKTDHTPELIPKKADHEEHLIRLQKLIERLNTLITPPNNSLFQRFKAPIHNSTIHQTLKEIFEHLKSGAEQQCFLLEIVQNRWIKNKIITELFTTQENFDALYTLDYSKYNGKRWGAEKPIPQEAMQYFTQKFQKISEVLQTINNIPRELWYKTLCQDWDPSSVDAIINNLKWELQQQQLLHFKCLLRSIQASSK